MPRHTFNRHIIRNRELMLGSVAVLSLGMVLAGTSAFAYGEGGSGASTGGGAGGVDGSLTAATGKNATVMGSSAGGGAVDLTTGNGAAGGSGGSSLAGSVLGTAGATGTTGLMVTTATDIATAISGGLGGPGSAQVNGISMAGGGGGGGVGVNATADITITGTGAVTGGKGSGGGGNAGGGGGAAGVFSSANVTVQSGGTITGGGGATKSGGAAAGIILTGGGTVRNDGSITGGAGGGGVATGGGGDGGAGVELLAGGTVVNGVGATITGGDGGSGRSVTTPVVASPGHGGAAIQGANIAVINAGTLTGGTGGAPLSGGSATADGVAIQFTGGVNSLEIWSTSTITGNVQAFSAADTFKLGGSTDASFDLSQIGAAGKYQGFGQFEKTGAGTWTLTGTSALVMPWTISQGILQISNDGQLGDPSGSLTFNGGALETTTSFSIARTISLAGNGTFLTDAGTTLTVTSNMSGPGGLTKDGSGTLVLTGANTYAGGTTIRQGTLQVGTGGTSGSLFGNIVDNGALVFDRSDSVTFGGTISGTGALSQIGTGTLILTGAGTYTGGTTIASGTLQVGDGGTNGSLIGNITNNGALVFDRSDSLTLSGAISGTGSLSQIGTGVTILTGASTYTGGTTIHSGTLTVDGQIVGQAQVASAGRLEGSGRVGDIVNAGVVAPGHGGIGTLTASSYTGQAGRLEIETVLGDDHSATDQLVANGATSGTSSVTVINRGGLGGQTVAGIRIIDVNGPSNGTFTLNGDYLFQGQPAVIAGAYGYRLYKDATDGDWYLRSSLLNPITTAPPVAPAQPLYQPGVPVYEAYTRTLLSLNGVATLQQRECSLAGAGTSDQTGGWIRIEQGRARPQTAFSTASTRMNLDTWQAQMGFTQLLGERGDGSRLVGGLTGHYGETGTAVTSLFGDGTIHTDGFGVGATLTWYSANGVYVDGQAQISWFDSDLRSATLGALTWGNNGQGETASLEIGKRMSVSPALTVVPQVQTIYSLVDFRRFADPASAEISMDRSASLKTRWGVTLDRRFQRTGGKDTGHVYAMVNLTYEWLGRDQVDVSGTAIGNRDRRLLGELGLGGSYSRDGGRLTLYSEATADTSLASPGDTYGVKGDDRISHETLNRTLAGRAI